MIAEKEVARRVVARLFIKSPVEKVEAALAKLVAPVWLAALPLKSFIS
ncbi:hypothetical protein HGG76_14285 [Ochrobactrum tritici]|jgi:hypothetical protein|uniref:Uncharacterized protein n=1 Tax=Brucella tritici TaxID=94626 RepID=A0A7X6FT69_9HYPH|nr:hypothetical protein [Bacillus sp. PR5]NKW10194.1 hypothetical protein [Brucella tritici]